MVLWRSGIWFADWVQRLSSPLCGGKRLSWWLFSPKMLCQCCVKPTQESYVCKNAISTFFGTYCTVFTFILFPILRFVHFDVFRCLSVFSCYSTQLPQRSCRLGQRLQTWKQLLDQGIKSWDTRLLYVSRTPRLYSKISLEANNPTFLPTVKCMASKSLHCDVWQHEHP